MVHRRLGRIRRGRGPAAAQPVLRREVRFGLSWLRYTWGFSWRYLISYTSTQGAALGMSSGVGAIAGARALGGLQGTVLLVRPFMTFQVAAIAASVGEVARSVTGDHDPRRPRSEPRSWPLWWRC